MKTAEEIAIKYVYGNHNALTDRQEFEDMKNDIIEFAKMHAEDALKQASEDAEVITMCQHGYGVLDRQSILNSYPLSLIK